MPTIYPTGQNPVHDRSPRSVPIHRGIEFWIAEIGLVDQREPSRQHSVYGQSAPRVKAIGDARTFWGQRVSEARSSFERQLGLVDQLIAIHGNLQAGRGRRHEQDALHRAGVVLTVAAWQAYVEKVIKEALDLIDVQMRDPLAASPAWAIHTFQLRRSAILNAVKKFNTPDDVKVRDLFQDSFNFSPWPHWAWRQGRRQWGETETRRRTNTWILVRHSIAHGFELPGGVDWLQGDNGQARLTLNLLNECRKHFVFLVDQTDSAFSAHIAVSHGVILPV